MKIAGYHLQGFAATMSMLATNLAGTVGKPVVDKTGLDAKYDWVLEWTPDVAATQNGEASTIGRERVRQFSLKSRGAVGA